MSVLGWLKTIGVTGPAEFRRVSDLDPMPVNVISGGGGGTGVQDLLFTDDTNAQFIYRDNGASPPVFTAYLVPAGTVYTVGSNPRPFAVGGTVATSAADGSNITFGSKADAAASSDTATATFMAFVKRWVAKIPTLGSALSAASLPVVIASDQSAVATTVADGGSATLGAKADTPATSDTGTFGLIALMKRFLVRFGVKAGIKTPSVTVGTTSTLAVAANTYSCWQTYQNVSTGGQVISISIDGSAATTTDHQLQPSESFTVPYGLNTAVNAISSAAGGLLNVCGV